MRPGSADADHKLLITRVLKSAQRNRCLYRDVLHMRLESAQQFRQRKHSPSLGDGRKIVWGLENPARDIDICCVIEMIGSSPYTSMSIGYRLLAIRYSKRAALCFSDCLSMRPAVFTFSIC